MLTWHRFRIPSKFDLLQPIRSKRSIIRRPTGLLIALNLAIVVMVKIEAQRDSLEDSVSIALSSNQHVPSVSTIASSNIDLPSRDAFNIISDRPLLVPERRLPTLPIIESQSVAIELVGIYLDDRERTALVKLGNQDDEVWVREGEFISSWQVEQIHADRLLLRRANELRLVYLWPNGNLAQQG